MRGQEAPLRPCAVLHARGGCGEWLLGSVRAPQLRPLGLFAARCHAPNLSASLDLRLLPSLASESSALGSPCPRPSLLSLIPSRARTPLLPRLHAFSSALAAAPLAVSSAQPSARAPPQSFAPRPRQPSGLADPFPRSFLPFISPWRPSIASEASSCLACLESYVAPPSRCPAFDPGRNFSSKRC